MENNGEMERQEEEPVMHHVKDYFCNQSPTEFDRVEDALRELFEIKEKAPRAVYCLYRDEEAVGAVSANTNLPSFYLFEDGGAGDISGEQYTDSGEIMGRLKDVPELISDIATSIKKVWGDDEATWGLDRIEDEMEGDVKLAIEDSSWDDAIREMEAFNREVGERRYPSLRFDSKLGMITGELHQKLVKGGFFTKRRIKKENKWYVGKVFDFFDAIEPCLLKYMKS